jgi:hypothetical protein
MAESNASSGDAFNAEAYTAAVKAFEDRKLFEYVFVAAYQ